MATNNSLKNQLMEKEQNEVNVQETILKTLINSDDIKSKFTEVLKETPTPGVVGVSDSHKRQAFGSLLKDKATDYINSIINLVNGDKESKEALTLNGGGASDLEKKGSLLIECEPRSIIDACIIAASLDLTVDKNLEYIWIVPYKKKANFSLGYKGYIQLLLRTGEYKSINIIEVCEGQLKSWNPLAEEFNIDINSKKSDAVIGYAGYFEMLNGFRKSVYWSKENMDAFRNTSFKSDIRWNNDYKAMAKRTIIRNMLSKWGSLSNEMQKAYCEDLNTDKFINN